MEFHPKKCQVLHVTNRRQPIKFKYSIHDQTLENVETAKYLGVNLHNKLCWNNHIKQITKKANTTRSFLQRNMHQCPRPTKVLCYQTLIRPLTEYASVIWDPFTESNIRKLEMVQRRSARFVFGDYRTTSSVTNMLNQLQWTSLQERRAQARAIMMYRVVHRLVDIPITTLTPASSLRGHQMKFQVPHTRTSTY